MENDDEPFEEKMVRLTSELAEHFERAAGLKRQLKANLEGFGYGF